MISDCSYCGIIELNGTGFFYDVGELSILVIPGATVFILWRMLVTNKKQLLVLGLAHSTSCHADLVSSEVPVYLRVLYLATAAVTFALGLLFQTL
jgi:hypothetical protein